MADTATQEWTRVDRELPPENTLIDWISPNGIQVHGGKRIGRLWFPGPPPFDMYVYYEPMLWRLTALPPEASP